MTLLRLLKLLMLMEAASLAEPNKGWRKHPSPKINPRISAKIKPTTHGGDRWFYSGRGEN
jgi:hypothetical protein